jgi:hypothetical protein
MHHRTAASFNTSSASQYSTQSFVFVKAWITQHRPTNHSLLKPCFRRVLRKCRWWNRRYRYLRILQNSLAA